ncbi:hypothetical protein [Asticcacaulis sp.]|uniref:hypothetical protein n=1 Tax=Asticcacaulis sp. TaxID=1872648 RepID=UPI0026224E4B|nr:hypothetical protein [Asticcacaulis sp.]
MLNAFSLPLPASTAAPSQNPVFTGRVSVPIGTTATPGIGPGGDPDTGLAQPGGMDTYSIVTGGTERVRVDQTRVMVGFTSPPADIPGNSTFALSGPLTTINQDVRYFLGNSAGFVTSGRTAIGISYNVTSNYAVIDALSGGVAWRPFVISPNATTHIGGTPGTDALRVNSTGANANRVQVSGTGAGTGPTIAAAGSDSNVTLRLLGQGSGGVQVEGTGGRVGFFGTVPAARSTVTGSKSGNQALASLLDALTQLGIITDATTA